MKVNPESKAFKLVTGCINYSIFALTVKFAYSATTFTSAFSVLKFLGYFLFYYFAFILLFGVVFGLIIYFFIDFEVEPEASEEDFDNFAFNFQNGNRSDNFDWGV